MELKPQETTGPRPSGADEPASVVERRPIEVEDLTEKAEVTLEVLAMINWVRNQRAQGRLPN